MWVEARHLLAMVGDEAVTTAAFCALLLFGITLLVRHDAGADRSVAAAIFGISALWLLLVMAGILRGDLARWSPLAVLLLGVGIETRPHRKHDMPKLPAVPDGVSRDRQSFGTDTPSCEVAPQPNMI